MRATFIPEVFDLTLDSSTDENADLDPFFDDISTSTVERVRVTPTARKEPIVLLRQALTLMRTLSPNP